MSRRGPREPATKYSIRAKRATPSSSSCARERWRRTMSDHEKLVVMVTHGPDEPELATIPFAMAGAAVASDVEVVMGFQGNGCRLVVKGEAEKVAAPEFAPLAGLLDSVLEFGGKLLVCGPCVKNRG